MAGSAALILVVILLVVGVGAAFLFLGNSSTPENIIPDGESATILGVIGEGPWGQSNAALRLKEADPRAKWIWKSKQALQDAGTNASASFVHYYNNESGRTFSATLHILIDNTGSWEFNNDEGGSIGDGSWNSSTAQTHEISIKEGLNKLTVEARSASGAAGVIFTAVKENGKVLFRSGKDTFLDDS